MQLNPENFRKIVLTVTLMCLYSKLAHLAPLSEGLAESSLIRVLYIVSKFNKIIQRKEVPFACFQNSSL